jgi:peptidyl-prolyl cis-trans isomerase SurA
MVALCDRKPTTVDTPKKKEIRDKMFTEKYETKSKAYLQDLRKAAMIEYQENANSSEQPHNNKRH